MEKVLVIGAARSGIAAAILLAHHNFEVYLTDLAIIEQKKELRDLKIVIYDQSHPDLLKDIDWKFIVKNPGIKTDVPFVKFFSDKKIPIYNEIEIACKYGDFKIAAITGTNGKTTITTLLAELLKRKYPNSYAVGNIGRPIADLINNDITSGFLALEIAAFQLLGCPSFKPKVATITNLTPDHLDYFTNVEDYYQAKKLIYQNMDDTDSFILNLDELNVVKYCDNINAKVYTLSQKQVADIFIQDNSVYLQKTKLFNLEDLRLVGDHNVSNAMSAAAMAYLMGVSSSDIGEGIRDFKGIEHRIEFVRTLNGVKYYNDSKATNVESTIVGLKSFIQNEVILLVGGYDKGLSFSDLKPYLSHVKTIISYGDTKNKFKDLHECVVMVNDLETAIKESLKISQKGDIVLLSPACASYDQFNSYEERGKLFKEIVLKIKEPLN
ncbi:MAG: UDP-N-acetylmuramoyl-L-alanine--D-glutamate ligase [Erysipelotrichaceae bacterium]